MKVPSTSLLLGSESDNRIILDQAPKELYRRTYQVDPPSRECSDMLRLPSYLLCSASASASSYPLTLLLSSPLIDFSFSSTLSNSFWAAVLNSLHPNRRHPLSYQLHSSLASEPFPLRGARNPTGLPSRASCITGADSKIRDLHEWVARVCYAEKRRSWSFMRLRVGT